MFCNIVLLRIFIWNSGADLGVFMQINIEDGLRLRKVLYLCGQNTKTEATRKLGQTSRHG